MYEHVYGKGIQTIFTFFHNKQYIPCTFINRVYICYKITLKRKYKLLAHVNQTKIPEVRQMKREIECLVTVLLSKNRFIM